MNRQGRRILKRYQIDWGVCKANFNLNSVALILATMKHYRKDLHFLEIDAKTDMLEILTCFRRGYLPGCPFLCSFTILNF